MQERQFRHAEALSAPITSEITPLPSETTSVFDARTERQKQALSLLEAGIESVLTSDGFANYLRMLSKFHSYSANNVLMIYAQRPDATKVNSYDRWRELNRQVMKGERGIKIWFPIFGTKPEVDPLTGEEHDVRYIRSFGIGNVFDISQTDGEPLPEPPRLQDLEQPDERAREVNLRLSRSLINQGLRLESRAIDGHARGMYFPDRDPQTIVIRRDAWPDEETGEELVFDPLSIGKTRTLLHEAAHYLADHRIGIGKDDAETVAEASAFVALEHFQIPTGEHSATYIAYWAKDKDVFRRNLGDIQKVSHQLISAIDDSVDPTAETEWVAPRHTPKGHRS
jgi:hypothetical protein